MDRCWAFTLAYNERVLMPYWGRHYRTFCEQLIVYVDTATTDGTDDLARLYGAHVRYHRTAGLDDFGFVAFAQEAYKEARGRAQWVIWVDADEFVYHPRLRERLDAFAGQGVTLPHVAGYAMVAEAPPSSASLHIWEELRYGLPAPEYSKPCVFSPELDLTWAPGKHTAHAAGGGATRDDGSDPLRLLHYRYLGEAWHVARNARNFARMDDRNRQAQHGREIYPDWQGADQKYSPAWFRAHAGEAQDVVTA